MGGDRPVRAIPAAADDQLLVLWETGGRGLGLLTDCLLDVCVCDIHLINTHTNRAQYHITEVEYTSSHRSFQNLTKRRRTQENANVLVI